jgi:hypothetical protein
MAAADQDGSLGPATVAAQADEGGVIDQPTGSGVHADSEPVSRTELNAWRRGFTPQAEIWNGRLAMLGLSVGLTVLLIARLAAR